jgi:hypothetical protein
LPNLLELRTWLISRIKKPFTVRNRAQHSTSTLARKSIFDFALAKNGFFYRLWRNRDCDAEFHRNTASLDLPCK